VECKLGRVMGLWGEGDADGEVERVRVGMRESGGVGGAPVSRRGEAR